MPTLPQMTRLPVVLLGASVLLNALLAVFLLGRMSVSNTGTGREPDRAPTFGPWLHASPQGRQPPRLVDPPRTAPPPTAATAPLVFESGNGGSSSAANGFVAVTGSYGVGTSVLYVLDTERRQIAVYEARGGAKATRRLTLVGARRIDLDLQLEGYNDESEFSFEDLERLFERSGSGGGAGSSRPEAPPEKRR